MALRRSGVTLTKQSEKLSATVLRSISLSVAAKQESLQATEAEAIYNGMPVGIYWERSGENRREADKTEEDCEESWTGEAR
jgi:hypothetical protein